MTPTVALNLDHLAHLMLTDGEPVDVVTEARRPGADPLLRVTVELWMAQITAAFLRYWNEQGRVVVDSLDPAPDGDATDEQLMTAFDTVAQRTAIVDAAVYRQIIDWLATGRGSGECPASIRQELLALLDRQASRAVDEVRQSPAADELSAALAALGS